MGSFELNFLPAHPLPKQIAGEKFMNKPLILYTALTKAVDNYNDRNRYTRGHLADAIGFIGTNAAIQFSNALNPLNHDKTLNDEKKYKLMHTFEHEDLMVFFTYYMQQFGLRPVAICRPKVTVVNFSRATDDATIKGNEAFKTTKYALRDETLTREELQSIIKENQEAAQKYQELVDLALGRLERMESEK